MSVKMHGRPAAASPGARHPARRSSVLATTLFALMLALTGCDGGGSDEGGIIGTGIQLRGTVPNQRVLARAEVGIRAASGESSTAPIMADGRFAADSLPGTGPWLLRVDLGNGDAWYAIAYPGDDSAVRNVHAYSDLALRNWFAIRSLSIDDTFSLRTAPVELPAASELAAIQTRIEAIIAGSLEAWGLAGVDLDTVSFDANDEGVDRFLTRNPVSLEGGRFTVVVSDPDEATQAQAVDGLPLSSNWSSSTASRRLHRRYCVYCRPRATRSCSPGRARATTSASPATRSCATGS